MGSHDGGAIREFDVSYTGTKKDINPPESVLD